MEITYHIPDTLLNILCTNLFTTHNNSIKYIHYDSPFSDKTEVQNKLTQTHETHDGEGET